MKKFYVSVLRKLARKIFHIANALRYIGERIDDKADDIEDSLEV
jgi:hypothetical protein